MKNVLEKPTIQYLNNVINYNTTFDAKLKVEDILINYSNIIKDYIIVFSKKINSKYLKNANYIFQKGFETITHVFEIILIYTKNLELTTYHSQKAIFFFIEFTEQITDEQNVFLQLTTRDASMFVYKKTIFEINNEYKRKNIVDMCEKDQEIINKFGVFTNIYNLLVNNNLETLEFIGNNSSKINKLKDLSELFLQIIEKIISLNETTTNKIDMLPILTRFLSKVNNKDKEYIKCLNKKFNDNEIDIDNINSII
jgi:hypothetical protein